MKITVEYKNEVIKALLEARALYTGTNVMFAKSLDIHPSILSTLKKGYRDGLLPDAKWMELGKRFGVTLFKRKWNIAKTSVFKLIEEEVIFCKEHSKSRIFVDDCGIGKTFTAKYLSRTVNNCFYVDASQAKSKLQFIKLLAKTLGVSERGKYAEILDNIKYYIHLLPKPIVIIDEAGDLEYSAFLELKALWNATEGLCGWYLMGADGLQNKIEKGKKNKIVGFSEIFSRFSENYSKAVPLDRSEKKQFYRQLITDVLKVNGASEEELPVIVNKCLVQHNGEPGGLRRAESLLILHS